MNTWVYNPTMRIVREFEESLKELIVRLNPDVIALLEAGQSQNPPSAQASRRRGWLEGAVMMAAHRTTTRLVRVTHTQVKNELGVRPSQAAIREVLRDKVVPWGFVYDKPYSARRRTHEGRPVEHVACLASLPAADGSLPVTECATADECPLNPLRVAERASSGRPAITRETVACPLGFWGLNRVIGRRVGTGGSSGVDLQSLRTWTTVIYALHAFSLVTGMLGAATVIGAFLTGWPSIIAVILNYVKRAETRGTWLESHFRWQIRTFWFGVLWAGLCAVSLILTLGLAILVVWIPLVALTVWFIYRIARGWLALVDRRPLYQ